MPSKISTAIGILPQCIRFCTAGTPGVWFAGICSQFAVVLHRWDAGHLAPMFVLSSLLFCIPGCQVSVLSQYRLFKAPPRSRSHKKRMPTPQNNIPLIRIPLCL